MIVIAIRDDYSAFDVYRVGETGKQVNVTKEFVFREVVVQDGDVEHAGYFLGVKTDGKAVRSGLSESDESGVGQASASGDSDLEDARLANRIGPDSRDES